MIYVDVFHLIVNKIARFCFARKTATKNMMMSWNGFRNWVMKMTQFNTPSQLYDVLTVMIWKKKSVDYFWFFRSVMALFGVGRGWEMILSHMASSCFNMSPCLEIWESRNLEILTPHPAKKLPEWKSVLPKMFMGFWLVGKHHLTSLMLMWHLAYMARCRRTADRRISGRPACRQQWGIALWSAWVGNPSHTPASLRCPHASCTICLSLSSLI